jgi:hypothetical protein
MDLFKKRSDVDEYNDLLAEVQQLRAIIGDQQALLDEHQIDNQHAYEEGGKIQGSPPPRWTGKRIYKDGEIKREDYCPACSFAQL